MFSHRGQQGGKARLRTDGKSGEMGQKSMRAIEENEGLARVLRMPSQERGHFLMRLCHQNDHAGCCKEAPPTKAAPEFTNPVSKPRKGMVTEMITALYF